MKKKIFLFALLAIIAFLIYNFFFADTGHISVLVFSKTEAYRHQSIAAGKQAILDLGQKHGFTVDTSEDATVFKEKQLQKYNVVVFLSTTGDVLNDAQQLEFNRFIQAGGGFVGIHAAADTEYDWPWYGKLVGAYFNSHPQNPNVREAVIQLKDKEFAATKHLPDEWKRKDEWYNYKDINPEIKVLLNLDETSYKGGTNGANHPITWYHEFDGGRAFYTGLGHTEETYSEPAFLKMLWGGIRYVGNEGKPVDFSKSNVAPEENRFVKEVLDDFLDEPMELDLLPDGRVLFIERGGAMKLFDAKVDSSRVVARLNVFSDLEDGLLGLALDPNFQKNNWLYLFYSPAGEKSEQHVSRFVFKNDSLDFGSEKILLKIATQRLECCHSAGSLEFGPQGLLYISVGDNTNPHASNGFAPIDERPGRYPWDAQKSSANTNDLRGKILRIKPEADGTYSIPDGNLFPKDGSKGRPEIYVMGCRNPYRISIDKHNGYLYWGGVGPDAGKDSIGMGPMGYDEINQARKAGYFGWPYFIANNKPYHERDFAKGTTGKAFDLKNPVNDSPNNTGSRELPPPQPAFIWYPYGPSKEFPLVGEGGRTAMAGPVYHFADYPENGSKFPEYYDGKLFIYEWMRGWIMAVTMEDNGDFKRMERFLPSAVFNNPEDMLFSPQGDIYMLEYGTIWFSGNPDARLIHLKYISGNRKPVAKVEADKTVGAAPLALAFKGEESLDFDGEDLTFEWKIDDGEVISNEKNATHTFSKAGTYNLKLTVKDPEGETGEANVEILVGNEPPQLEWTIKGNRSFFWDNEALDYQITVKDKEDGTLAAGIDPASVFVSIDYFENGQDDSEIALGHQALTNASVFLLGKKLMDNSDCKTCHQPDQKSIGPSYRDIAARYREDDQALRKLTPKIINGGGGVWGETVMAAHPQLSQSEVEQMVKYILSLSDRQDLEKSLPVAGTYILNQHKPTEQEGTYILTASYTDKGGQHARPLTARKIVALHRPVIQAVDFDEINGATKFKVTAGMVPGVKEDLDIVIGNSDGSVVYKNLDLTDIQSIELGVGMAANFFGGGDIEFHLDGAENNLIGTLKIEQGLTDFGFINITATIQPTEGRHDLYLVFKSKDGKKPVCSLIFLQFKNSIAG